MKVSFRIGALALLCSACGEGMPAANPDAGSSTLYERLGGNAGIKGAVDAIVAAEVMDPQIAAFFAPATMAGHTPSVAQIKECLVLQIGNAAGGPEQYPAAVSGGFTCRSMAAAHAGLGISSEIFDKFVMIAAATLTSAGVAPADVATLGGVLNSTKSMVTGPNLYQRLGGNAGIKGAVDAIVAAEVMDPQIAAFFAPATMAGHTPSVAQIKECLVLQIGNAAGGPEQYPAMVSGGFTCRSMAAAHAGLGIPATVFDKFVMIAAATLTSAGVSAADVATLGGVLNSTKTDVVQ